MDLERSIRLDEDDTSRPGFLSVDQVVTDFGFAGLSTKSKEDSVSTPEIAKEDSERVWWLRVLVILVLVVASISIAVPLRNGTHDSQVRAYEADFTQFASKVIDTYYRNIEDKIWTAYSLSVALTSDTQRANLTWPGISIADFETRAFGATKMVNAIILFAPLLTNLTRAEWEEYAIDNEYQLDAELADDPNCQDPGFVDEFGSCRKISDGIFKLDGPYLVDQTEQAMYSPLWQVSSGVRADDSAMFDQMSEPIRNRALLDMIENRVPVVSDVIYAGYDYDNKESQTEPRSLLFFPVYEFVADGSKVVGSISIDFEWKSYFAFSLKHSSAVDVVLLNLATNQYWTFQAKNNEVRFVAEGDHHDPRYDGTMVESSLDAFDNLGIAVKVEYLVRVYPTRSYEDEYITNRPALFAAYVVIAFFFAGCAFLIYDFVVRRRQRLVLASAERTTKIVDSLFPKQIQKRMFKRSEARKEAASKDANGLFWRVGGTRASANSPKKDTAIPQNFDCAVSVRLRSFLDSSPSSRLASDLNGNDPIADLFPETTILFADISGFTAWSSEREPPQIFLLLETLYQAFDQIASRLGVFKVETIGDCYVAVAGLPEPNKKHALIMGRFAYECMIKTHELVKELEATLGPGTSDLTIRVGLHSGSVTAGVLRGEKARFQLFGDAMNTASRMESTGKRGSIQLSQDTADYFIAADKSHWIKPREGLVSVKGKGELQTYWLIPSTLSSSEKNAESDHSKTNQVPSGRTQMLLKHAHESIRQLEKWGHLNLEDSTIDAHKKARLINWNVEILVQLLSKVVASRIGCVSHNGTDVSMGDSSTHDGVSRGTMVIDEVTEIITLPTFNKSNSKSLVGAVPLSDDVRAQLHSYVTALANFYHDVPFHNMEHASHVTLSANKLMKRIIATASNFTDDMKLYPGRKSKSAKPMGSRSSEDIYQEFHEKTKNLHDNTFGISSDPLTQFSIVFSALIHDVGHKGVTNAQLVLECSPTAQKYQNKSVAEQNSVDIAWNLLSESQFSDLRSCIYSTSEEKRRFRQLVVNSVMATDIADKELKLMRNKRWDTAFHEASTGTDLITDKNRKATIVIEHIIQASDVAHTMQHWHIYCKWNERLFQEQMLAFIGGQGGEKDPIEGWYGGEIWFFDNYIIPLAYKLKECGVFGVSGDEYLSYALENRREWEMKGRDVCSEMLENFNEQYPGHYPPKKMLQTEEECDVSNNDDDQSIDVSML